MNISIKVKELCRDKQYDAVVVGSGPNGLACAITMLQHGHSVLLVEGQSLPGGGCRTMELTAPGFKNDVCSAVHPMGLGSPLFRTLGLERYGLEWINPDATYGHAFEPGRGFVAHQSVEATAEGLRDSSYSDFMAPLVPNWETVCEALLKPIQMLKFPVQLSLFGAYALQSAYGLGRRRFRTEPSRGLFAGAAAHAAMSLELLGSASLGLSLAIVGHAVGWPIPRGGAQSVTNALIALFEDLGGELILNAPVRSLSELPACKYLFFDLTPKQVIRIADEALPQTYKSKLESYKYGPSVFKLDWALSRPIPWVAEELFAAPTVHIGGTLKHIARSEGEVWDGKVPERPYILLTQPSLFDDTRAPEGKHTAWAYCHLPFGNPVDFTDVIEAEIERYAPGFRDTIIRRSKMNGQRFEEMNENHIGGDINGGTLALPQLLARPVFRLIPYATPLPNVYFCSSSTPPGSGVHGMCGYYAAQAALKFGDAKAWAIR